MVGFLFLDNENNFGPCIQCLHPVQARLLLWLSLSSVPHQDDRHVTPPKLVVTLVVVQSPCTPIICFPLLYVDNSHACTLDSIGSCSVHLLTSFANTGDDSSCCKNLIVHGCVTSNCVLSTRSTGLTVHSRRSISRMTG